MATPIIRTLDDLSFIRIHKGKARNDMCLIKKTHDTSNPREIFWRIIRKNNREPGISLNETLLTAVAARRGDGGLIRF